jgi:hypothetical protein
MSGSKKYTDISFPMDWTSIFWPESNNPTIDDYYVEQRAGWKKTITTYKRPSEIDTSPSLWGTEGVRPAAALQGDNGDCWLLGMLAALAEWSDRSKLLFRNKNYTEQASKNGVF